MKRLILFITFVFGGLLMTYAQPRSIGGSFGWSETITYQHSLSSNNFVEFYLGYHCGLIISDQYSVQTGNSYVDGYYEAITDVALRSAGTLRLSAVYNMIFMSPQWTNRGEWNLYAGPGATLGTGFNRYKAFSVGITGQVGLEYSFWFPLQLSVDLRPTFGMMVSENRIKYDVEGLMGFIPTISAKFKF